MRQPINIVWFKRDLRLHDHAPLMQAVKSGLPVLPLYVVEPEYWRQPFASRRHWHFIHDCLTELRSDLTALGQTLVVRVGEVTEVLSDLQQQYSIQTVFAHEETGNLWTYDRDIAVAKWCREHKVNFDELPSNGIVRRLKSRDNWAAIRSRRMAQDIIAKPPALLPIHGIEMGEIPAKDDALFGADMIGVTQLGGRRAAVKVLQEFLLENGSQYLARISAPGLSEKYCSRLSPHLAWGTLSSREVMQAIQRRREAMSEAEQVRWKRSLSAFEARISWRCHFMQKLEDKPDLEKVCMHPAFEGMRENEWNEDYFTAWKAGETGYPFIDACMRNLVHNGWITFRMRAMLVSFASYHLWLDWRRTGYFLAQTFTDYEPGIHYSQLQMQSGVTGINAIRMYNPVKQSQDQDPEGAFIREWVPELRNVPDMWIHTPWEMPPEVQQSANCLIGQDYPAPIVTHVDAVRHARSRLSDIRRSDAFRDIANQVYTKLGSRMPSPARRKAKSRNAPRKPEDNPAQITLPL